MGSNDFQLNDLLQEIIDVTGKLYEYNKHSELFDDFQQLFARHDLEYVLQVNKKYADLRLAY